MEATLQNEYGTAKYLDFKEGLNSASYQRFVFEEFASIYQEQYTHPSI